MTLNETEAVTNSEDFLLACRYGELDQVLASISGQKSLNSSARDDPFSYRNMAGNTALHMACANGHVEIVKILLDNSSLLAVNSANNEGNTALHWASLNGHEEIVKLLLSKGADADVVNKSGRNALSEAQSRGFEGITILLLQHMKIGDDLDGKAVEADD